MSNQPKMMVLVPLLFSVVAQMKWMLEKIPKVPIVLLIILLLLTKKVVSSLNLVAVLMVKLKEKMIQVVIVLKTKIILHTML